MFLVAISSPSKYGLMSLPEDIDATVYFNKREKYKQCLFDHMIILRDKRYLGYINDIVEFQPTIFLELLNKIIIECESIDNPYAPFNSTFKDIVRYAKIDFEISVNENIDD